MTLKVISFLCTFLLGLVYGQNWQGVGLIQGSSGDLTPDPLNNLLYISGAYLQNIDSTIFNGIAGYQAGNLFPLGTGFLGNPLVSCTGVIDNHLYAGGWADPTIERSIAKYNPQNGTWSPLANAPWGTMRGFKIIDSLLYFYGGFNYPDSIGPRQHVGVIVNDTCYYSPYFPPITQSSSSFVMDMEKYQDHIYIAGSFSINGSTRVFGYSDGTQIQQVGQWISSNDHVASLEIWQDKLILGGYFPGNGLNNDISLLAYDGYSLQPLIPDNPFLVIYALESFNNLLILAGYLIDSGVCDVQVFDGSSLTSITNFQLNNGVRDMEIFNDTLYIAGFFQNCFPPEIISGVAKYSTPLSELSGISSKNQISKGILSLSPNPCTTTLTISSVEIPFQYEFYNLHGQEVSSGNSTSKQLDVSSLLPGIYFLKVKDRKGTRTGKVVKVE